ncbi:MAG TPA: hypothetical protein VFT68_04775 [Lapillicoccus sp.]|nr:hypothetical protein [Lapillicoccus sp.]
MMWAVRGGGAACPDPGRRHRALVATAGSLVALSLASGCSLIDSSQAATDPGTSAVPFTPTPSASPTTDPAVEARHAASDLVGQRVSALAAKNKATWLATVTDPGSGFGADQAALFDRMAALPIGQLALRDVAVERPPGAPATGEPEFWVARVRQTYAFTGYDPGQRDYTVSYLLKHTTEGWRFTGEADGTNDVQPFDLAGLSVVSSPDTLVIGDLPKATLRAYLALGDAAHDRIAAVWGEAQPAVIVAPSTVDKLKAQLGPGRGEGFDQIAAVTDGPLIRNTAAQSDRVYLNPEAFQELSATGRSVVVTHELTHVTVRATTTRSAPIWLSEGFADDVAITPSGLPVRSVAADLLDQVKAGKPPAQLPDEAAFDPTKGQIAPSYSAAWLAVSRMRQRFGQAKVVAFYRAVAGPKTGEPGVTANADQLTHTAFDTVLGTTQDAFVADWLAYLKRLSR